MILQALCEYYQALAAKGEISRPGWNPAKVGFALVLGGDGSLIDVMRLKETVEKKAKKKKTGEQKVETVEVARIFQVPKQATARTVGITANFLCDTPAYFLGIDGNGNDERAGRCFQASAALHKKLLEKIDSPAARAVCSYFDRWDPAAARSHPELQNRLNEILKGGNLVFRYCGEMLQDNPTIAKAWDDFQNEDHGEQRGQCLVTGAVGAIARLHPSIKGVKDAQPSGAALVSFNAPSYESYGKEQSFNAPVSEEAAFAYTTALNHLLADWEHVKQFGGTTMVYWAENAEHAYQTAMDIFMNGANDGDEQFQQKANALKQAMVHLAHGETYPIDGVELSPDIKFYILGLSPNIARLSVRFFHQNTFGGFMNNLYRHEQRIEIIRPSFDARETLSPDSLLFETVNKKSKDKAASGVLTGALMRSILNDQPYPEALYQNVLLRIQAEHDITRGQAAIIKAVHNKKREEALKHTDGGPQGLSPALKEEYQVKLDESSEYLPYVLGRLFSVLENIQESAIPNLNSTIKDRYFTSASATPSSVFPGLLDNSENHLKVLKRDKHGLYVDLSQQVEDLLGRIRETFPKRLNTEERGAFYIGYYHQTQKRYTKKNKPEGEAPEAATEEQSSISEEHKEGN